MDGLSIPENEVTYTASRSGGPGGQNVNKVSSRVTLHWDIRRSSAVSDDQRRRITERLASRINKDGILRMSSQKTRSQDMNRTDVLMRFVVLIQDALRTDPPRVETSIPRSARDERLAVKKKRTHTKQLRAKKPWDVE